MIAFALLCLLAVRRAKAWQEELSLIEADCNSARDLSMMQATILRSQLAGFREKLEKKPEPGELESMGNLFKQAVPMFGMLLSRETNLFKLGLAGFKLCRSAMDYFGRNQEKERK